jgi:arginyl-tRNA synthetase
VRVRARRRKSSLQGNSSSFGDVIYDVEKELYPNRLCDYLFETSQKFSKFYETCSVIKAETEELKASRLTLSVTTAKVLTKGLDLLGIDVVDRL